MNPFRHLRKLFRRKPAIVGSPPSARQVPVDPADHAEDFSHRYAQEMDVAAGEVLMDLGIEPGRLGATDPEDLTYKTFHPGERTVGGVTPDGRITLDSGVMNPDAMDAPYGRGPLAVEDAPP